jgi:uncharacterized protein
MAPESWILTEAYAGLQAQAFGLAEAAGLAPTVHVLEPRAPWRWVAARTWPSPLAAVGLGKADLPGLVIGCGGTGGAVGAAMRKLGRRVVQIQNPRMPIGRFDLVVVNRHDELTGPNVLVTRTALHRVTPERLAEARPVWEARLAHLPRPLVAVMVGGSNGRYRLDEAVAESIAGQLAQMMRQDKVGLALTPSRRTDPGAIAAFRRVLEPLGAWIWDGTGDNPYFGMLALADVVVVTMDSVSMVSEAAATSAPVLVASLPGKSRRIGLFLDGLKEDGRIREFQGRFETWAAAPLNDTQEAADEMRRRLGF